MIAVSRNIQMLTNNRGARVERDEVRELPIVAFVLADGLAVPKAIAHPRKGEWIVTGADEDDAQVNREDKPDD